MPSTFKPRPLKNLFTANQCWAQLLEAGDLRPIEVESVSKMLACSTSILGVKHYTCANDHCHHVNAIGANVIAIDISQEKLDLARALGAIVTINAQCVADVTEAVLEITQGGAHVSLDALGHPTTCFTSTTCAVAASTSKWG